MTDIPYINLELAKSIAGEIPGGAVVIGIIDGKDGFKDALVRLGSGDLIRYHDGEPFDLDDADEIERLLTGKKRVHKPGRYRHIYASAKYHYIFEYADQMAVELFKGNFNALCRAALMQYYQSHKHLLKEG